MAVALENTEQTLRHPPQHAATPEARPGATLTVASLATALVLIVFTVPLTTLTSTARALAAGPGAQAGILSAMSLGAAAGLLGCAAGQLAVYGLHADGSIIQLLPGMFVAGAANGVLNAAGRQAVANVPADRSAMGSGANNTARYLGAATGLTVCATIITHAGAGSGVAGLLSGWNVAVLVTVGFSLLKAAAVLAHERSRT